MAKSSHIKRPGWPGHGQLVGPDGALVPPAHAQPPPQYNGERYGHGAPSGHRRHSRGRGRGGGGGGGGGGGKGGRGRGGRSGGK